MSIKKLFDSNKPNDVLTSTNLEEEVVKNAPELESADNVREQIDLFPKLILATRQTSLSMVRPKLIMKMPLQGSIESSLMMAHKKR